LQAHFVKGTQMNQISRDQLFNDLLTILDELSEDWEYSGEISLETTFLEDMGFESIDVVAFGMAIEEHYKQAFPFAEFLAAVGQREVQDIRVGEIVDFIYQHLDGSKLS
jgi:acyl carrier protein